MLFEFSFSSALTGEFESQQISKFKLGFSSVNISVYFNLFQDIKLQNTNRSYLAKKIIFDKKCQKCLLDNQMSNLYIGL